MYYETFSYHLYEDYERRNNVKQITTVYISPMLHSNICEM